MVARPSVKANEVKPAMAFTEVVNGVVASGDGVLEWECDSIEFAVANA